MRLQSQKDMLNSLLTEEMSQGPEQKACIIRGRTITRQGNDDSIFCAYPSPEIAYYKENVALNSEQ